MIEANEIFSDFDTRIALWCDAMADTSDIAMLADSVIENKIPLISVVPENVSFLWTCLEKTNVKMFARYFFETSNKNIDNDVSVLSKNIVSVLKQGADGIQIFVKVRDFERVIDLLSLIRDDLFFDHKLCIVLNIQDIDVSNWDLVFEKLREIRADSFGIHFDEDMGNRSDFIGRIYSMLQHMDFDGDMHFMLGDNFDRIDQVVRLTEALRPELSDKLHFFIEY